LEFKVYYISVFVRFLEEGCGFHPLLRKLFSKGCFTLWPKAEKAVDFHQSGGKKPRVRPLDLVQ
jgi:hypothetical protein